MMIDFEWDPQKEKANIEKHHIGFREASTIFKDPLGLTIFDPDHSIDEDRYITYRNIESWSNHHGLPYGS